MSKRTCDRPGCDRTHLARGMCSSHYSDWWYASNGKSKHRKYERTCETCGGRWLSPRADARFCTAKCKGVHLSAVNKRACHLDAEHAVMLRIAADRAERKRASAEARAERAKSDYSWRTARECPGCGCRFTPLYTSTTVTCGRRCSRRLAKQRRRAREHGAYGTFTWAEFMRIAKRFDYCCAYCGIKPERLDPDHVVPLSRGGANTPANLLPSCFMCNSSKGAMTLPEWSAWLVKHDKPKRSTSWTPSDPRYAHLTESLLINLAAA